MKGTQVLAIAVWSVALALATGCESRVSLGQRCASSAECERPLICAVGGRCRVECSSSADCPAGERCLVDGAGVPACSVDRETCTTDCAEGLECVRGECQSGCTSSAQCPDGVCTIERYCLTPTRDDAGTLDAPAALDASEDASNCAVGPAVADAAVGWAETCAATRDGGEVYCWGYFPAVAPRSGGIDCAQGPGLCYARPTRIAGLTSVREVVLTARAYACARHDDGSVDCWGSVDGTSSLTPTPILREDGSRLIARAIVAGEEHVCAVGRTDGHLYCWGRHSLGRLGDGVDDARVTGTATRAALLPDPVSVSLSAVTGLALGWDTTLVIGSSVLAGVGLNDAAQLGVGASSTPVLTPTSTARMDAESVATSIANTCILRAGAIDCWGLVGDLLGGGSAPDAAACLGTEQCTATPVRVPSAIVFEDLLADPYGNTMFAIDTDGAVYGWGAASGPILESSHVRSPTRVAALGDRLTHRLSVGNQSACAVTESTGELVCWGNDENGQLGRGTVHPASSEDPSLHVARPPCW
ncbi:MAG: hypothetical protein K1X94_06290 [Sandaracinaceae bacterium]|nr:hypothetical protein [Sandaracinaceae bacterium]